MIFFLNYGIRHKHQKTFWKTKNVRAKTLLTILKSKDFNLLVNTDLHFFLNLTYSSR